MVNGSINKLISQRDEVLDSIKKIEETCEGIDNERNSNKINLLNIEKAKLLSDKNRLSEELVGIERNLNKINEDIRKLSSKGILKILEAIKNQRCYFFKNKPKVIFDRDTGLVWANLDYFNSDKNGSYFGYDEANELASNLILDGIDNWQIPSKNDFQVIFSKEDFPFRKQIEKKGYPWFAISTYNYALRMKSYGWSDENSSAYLLPYNTIFTEDDYEKKVNKDNKIYTEAERLQFTLNLFVNNGLEPIFDNEEVTEMYKKIYIKKPELVNKLNDIQEQIDRLQQEVLISSTFDYNTTLVKYDIKAIDNSIIKYYEAVQSWVNELMNKLSYFEDVKGDIIRDFNIISLKLSKKYEENPNLTEEENILFKTRQQFFKKHFELGMSSVKSKLLSVKKQADDLEYRIDEINDGNNAIKELALLEKEERASFNFVTENTANIIKNALIKIEYFEKNKLFATNIIDLEDKWTENYKVFKTTIKEQLKNNCEEDSIEEEIWSLWYEDWTKKRCIIEMCFLPLVEKVLKGYFITNKLQTDDNEKVSNVTTVEKLIALLENYKCNLDNFYLEERKNIYQKFAFQAGGDLQEKFEAESELYKISSQFQKNLQDIIFDLDKAEERIFLLRWANDLIDIQIDEILDFVKDKELSKISQNVLVEFADLKRKNYENFISDAKAYSEERANREKQYNSLMFKMRKELMK